MPRLLHTRVTGRTIVYGLALILSCAAAAQDVDPPEPRDLIRAAMEHWRGVTSFSEMTMIVQYCPGCNEPFTVPPGDAHCPQCHQPLQAVEVPSTLDLPLASHMTVTIDSVMGRDTDRREAPADLTDQLVGNQIDSYEIETFLGKGGMAWVFRARHTSLHRSCAIKILCPSLLARDDDSVDPANRG